MLVYLRKDQTFNVHQIAHVVLYFSIHCISFCLCCSKDGLIAVFYIVADVLPCNGTDLVSISIQIQFIIIIERDAVLCHTV